MNVYKNTTEMSKKELQPIVDLIIELDKLAENENPAKQLELVTAIQTLVRIEEAVEVKEVEEGVTPEATDEAEAPAEDAAPAIAEAA